MKNPIGKKRWAIADGYIPEWSTISLQNENAHDATYALTSHEAVCILNSGDKKASVQITVFFKDLPSAGSYRFEIEAERTFHLRMNELDPEKLCSGVDYSAVIESDVPIVVQHTRLDTRQTANAIMTSIAYSEE